ncbi:MAG: family 1 extracellular solute-binding protein [Paenibacillus sp.]|jgi:multiple sugar transport system substrate-binding protein|nr:family 1 extracellular solute-binding protein [Paenibacillus sp.]
MIRKYRHSILGLLLASVAMTGCDSKSASTAATDGSAEREAAAQKPLEPVTLQLFSGTTLTNDEFNMFIVEPVKKKFPHITITLQNKDDINTRESLAVTKNFPDLIYDSDTVYWNKSGLNILEPLDGYIQKNKLDTGKLAKKNIGSWESLPMSGNFIVNWINKDVFDKFGVPYPKEVQRWEQVLELNKKLVGKVDDVQYIGMYPDFHFMGQGLSLRYINPKTNKAEVNNDQWKKILTVVKDAVDVPGFIQGKTYKYRREEWLKNRNVAMVIATGNQMIGPLTELAKSGSPMNWDMAPFPNFQEKFGISPSTGGQEIMMTSTSKHKDEAFQVMMHLLSEDVQTIVSRTGKMPAIRSAKVEAEFGAGVDSLKGKNIAAIFKTQPASDIELSEYNSTIGKKAIDDIIPKLVLENIDVNSVLRMAEEDINKKMEAALAGH